MCKIITIVKKPGENREVERLLQLQSDALGAEPDGIGAMTISANNEIEVFRSMHDYEPIINNAIKKVGSSKLISIHTRTGTSGERSAKNIHFFKPNDWYFAHNGWVSKYHGWNGGASTYWSRIGFQPATKREPSLLDIYDDDGIEYGSRTGYCDSYQFVKNLPAEINKATLLKFVEQTKFFGIGLLVHEKGNEAYLLAIDKPSFALSDNKTYTAISSYAPILQNNGSRKLTLNGIEANAPKTYVTRLHYIIRQGVHRISWWK
jgi:hypothetical protein